LSRQSSGGERLHDLLEAPSDRCNSAKGDPSLLDFLARRHGIVTFPKRTKALKKAA
jgi:hypothetical protein